MTLSLDDIAGALERAAGAGDPRISASFGLGAKATVSDERMGRVREIIKRFCEHIEPDTTAAEILEMIDMLP